MRRRGILVREPEPSGIDGALEVLDAEELRELTRELLLELDGSVRESVVDRLVARAAKKGVGWVPEGPGEDVVAEIVSFVEAGKRDGYAEPHRVDTALRRGSDAFHRKEYEVARRIFGALLPPISNADLYLGQHEVVGEVLGVDEALCAARYAVSVYMATESEHRAEAVHSAIRDVGNLGPFREPLREMERVAVEPLSDLDDFLTQWRGLLEGSVGGDSRHGWLSDEHRWLREVVQRTEGTGGLARVARASRHGEDLRAWCRALVESGEWQDALSAFEESAAVVRDGVRWRGEFLDGAALAAQELGRRDLPTRLELAWRQGPSLLRLRRWLGSARTRARVRKLAHLGLEVCPKQAQCQRAVLHLVLGDYESAANRLAAGPGLGWSDSEHPGHLLMSLFPPLLESRAADAPSPPTGSAVRGFDLDVLESGSTDPNEPRLRAVEIAQILALAGAQGPISGKNRSAVLAGMRKAAAKRVEGVTRKQRHRYYGHAAWLVATCAALDPSSATDRWVERLRAKYSRYPALRRELNEYLGQA